MLAVVPPPLFLLVDDHALFRTGLRMLLAQRWPGARLSEVDSMEALMAHPPETCPQLILLDVTLPGIHGLAGLAWLRRQYGGVPVVMLSAHDDAAVVAESMRLGANGFVSKAAMPDDLIHAFKLACDGREVWPEQAASPPVADGEHWRPSEQQHRILGMLAAYKSNKALARSLNMPEDLVRAEVSTLMERMGVISRAAVLEVARKEGWVTSPIPRSSIPR
jgi:DNA-binding NarL/FixJ family response regulator